MDMLSAIGLAIAAVLGGPIIRSSLGSLRRSEDLRKERE